MFGRAKTVKLPRYWCAGCMGWQRYDGTRCTACGYIEVRCEPALSVVTGTDHATTTPFQPAS